MKRTLILLFCIVTVLLSACSPKQEAGSTLASADIEEVTIAPTEAFISTAPMEPASQFLSVAVPMTTDRTCTDDGAELFSYSYQYMKLEFPDDAITEKVTLDFLNRVDASQNDAQIVLDMAQADFSQTQQWIPYFYRIIYNPSRIDSSVLSLYGMQSSYSGGMHGNVSAIAANYDMHTGEVLTFGSIMHMDAEKEDFILLVIEKLSKCAEQYYLYEDYADTVRQRLGGDENLYEDFYFTTTGLNFFFSPYEIAPYASGIISVEIPYEELPGLLYDDYFPAERYLVEGSVTFDVYGEKNIEHISNTVEINLDGEDELYLLSADGTVEDVRISVDGDKISIPAYTAFLAYELSWSDAVLLKLPEGLIDRLNISYQSAFEPFDVKITQ